jgi:hypothetical protein
MPESGFAYSHIKRMMPSADARLVSFHPERVLFRPGAVGPPVELATASGGGAGRISTLREAVPKYASAQPLYFLASTKNASFSNRNLAGRGIRSGVSGWTLVIIHSQLLR